jgi:hypothetical protein
MNYRTLKLDLTLYNRLRFAIVALAAFAAVDYTFGEDTQLFGVLRGVVLLLTPMVFWIHKANGQELLGRGSVFLWTLLFGIALQAGLFCAWPSLWVRVNWGEVEASERSISAAARISILALLGLCIGGYLASGRFVGALRPTHRYAQVSVYTWYAIIILGAAGSTSELYLGTSVLSSTGRALALVGSVGLIRSSLTRKNASFVHKIGAFGVLLGLAAVDVLSRAQRGAILAAFVPLAYLYMRYRGSISRFVVLSAVISIVALVTLLPAINSFRTSGLSTISISDLQREIKLSYGTGATVADSVEWIVLRLTYIPFLGEIVNSTPERVNFYGGETYLQLPLWTIPRYFWQDKPDLNTGGRMARDYLGWNDLLTERRSAVAPSVHGEAYANFGQLGVVCICALLGFLLIWINSQVLRSEARWPFVNACLNAYCVGLITLEQALDHYLLLTKASIILLLPIAAFSDFLWRTSNRNQAERRHE